MFTKFTRPIVFGHRGACAHAPENTLASFRLAVEQGADFIELDAKLSKDNVVMVIHDPTVDRTTNGKGKVNALTLAELKKLDAGSRFDAKFAGESIPTLDEVFRAVGQQIYVNVELTNYSSKKDNLVQLVAKIVLANHMEDRVIFSSFYPENLVRIHELLPQAPTAILCLPGLPGLPFRSSLLLKTSPHLIHPFLSDVTEKMVMLEHNRERRVHVWTVNEANDIERLVKIGVDGIFTDDPLKAKKIINGG
ncbi:MAG: glycerophosphodiester phosphodiesterase [Anaerolineaceae bacterium]